VEVRSGYKQTEVGVIPEDWEVKQIGAFEPFVTSGSRGWAMFYAESGSPFVRITNLSRTCIYPDMRDLRFVQIAANDSEGARTQLLDGDVLISITADIGIVGHVTMSVPKPAYINQHIALVRFDSTRVNSRFVSYFLASEKPQRLFRALTDSGAKAGMNLTTVQRILIALPPTRAEQEAIAEALSDADALIESLDQLLAKKRQLKQGAMQELLTGKKRLPGFSGAWEVERLGDLGSTFGGLTGKTKRDFGHGPARYITFMNIMANVVIDSGTFEFVDIKPTESQNRVANGDLFFNGSSETPEEVGMCAVLTQNVQDVYLNSFCFGFRFRNEVSADGCYLAYFFRSRVGRELLRSLAQGATRYNLSKTALLKVTFALPHLPEQSAIAATLSDMDAELAALEAKLTKARSVKQGMMQELLTGRIRLV